MDEFISVQVDNMMIDTVASLATKQSECYIYIHIYIYIYKYIYIYHNANTLNAGDKMMLGHEDSFSL